MLPVIARPSLSCNTYIAVVRMMFRRKLIILGILVLSLLLCLYVFPLRHHFVPVYDRFIYYPFQSLRTILFGFLPFSLGDVVYVLGGAWALYTIVRWVSYVIKFRSQKRRLAASVLRCVNTVLFVYLFFFIGWGANYNKVPLRKYWHLDTAAVHKPDTAALIAFDRFLLEKLNATAPYYHRLPFSEVSDSAVSYYRAYTDSKVKNGLGIKPSLFSFYMERLAVEGYYNPFTGEGQVNRRLPDFMQPFVVCHEMAHQAGIAAEGDANLMAYAVGTAGNDTSFSYSCYLNIWLYTNNRLWFRDSTLSKNLEAQLNPLTRAHIDTLEAISEKYHNDVTKYSGELYDSYLRMEHQKDGIRSYGNVSSSAWQLELQRSNGKKGLIQVP